MEALRKMLMALLATGFLLGAAGCDTEGPAEQTGEEVDQTMERSGEQMEETFEGEPEPQQQ